MKVKFLILGMVVLMCRTVQAQLPSSPEVSLIRPAATADHPTGPLPNPCPAPDPAQDTTAQQDSAPPDSSTTETTTAPEVDEPAAVETLPEAPPHYSMDDLARSMASLAPQPEPAHHSMSEIGGL